MPVRGKFFDPKDPVYDDLLKESTRKFRRALLMVSSVALVALVGNIFPSGIPSLGIEFRTDDRILILWCIGISVGYFLMQFHIRARMDMSRHFQATYRFGIAQAGWNLSGTEQFDLTEQTTAFMRSLMSTKTQPMWKQIVAFWYSDWHMKAQVVLDYWVPMALGVAANAGVAMRLWNL